MQNIFKVASEILNGVLDLGVKLLAVAVVLQILFGAQVQHAIQDFTCHFENVLHKTSVV